MPTSKFDNVPSGDALSAETANAINFAAIPAGVTLSSDNIERLSERTAEVAGAFARRLENLQAAFSEARERYGRDTQDLINSAEPDARQAARTLAKSQEASRINMMRRNLVNNSVKERGELLDRLARFAAEAEFLSSLCASPEMMLGRIALGDTKRNAYMQQLDGAGPVELETAARTAIATGDIVLAASIGTVVDRRPRDRRPFSVHAFAARVLGEEHKRVTALLDGIQLAHKSAVAADREFVRGRAYGLTNLSLALSRRAIAQATASTKEA